MKAAEKEIVAKLVNKFFSTMCMNPKTYEVVGETLETIGNDILNQLVDNSFSAWLEDAAKDLKKLLKKADKKNTIKFAEPYEKGELFLVPWLFDRCTYAELDTEKVWGEYSLEDEYYEDYFDDSEIIWWEYEGWSKLVEVLQKEGVVVSKYCEAKARWYFFFNNDACFWTDKIPKDTPISFNIKGGEITNE